MGGPEKSFWCCNRRHTPRDRRPCTLACQAAGWWGHINRNSVQWGKKIFCTGLTRASKTGYKVSCTSTTSPTKTTNEGPPSYESLFSLVSPVSRGHPSLVSLVATLAHPATCYLRINHKAQIFLTRPSVWSCERHGCHPLEKMAQCTGTGGAVYRHWWRSV